MKFYEIFGIGGNALGFGGSGSTTLAQSDIPSAAIKAVDNSIQTAAVDANGNPNHIVTAASTALLPINGGTTSLNMYIAGKPMQLATNVTTTLTTGVNYVYALGDVSTLVGGQYQLVAADFIASLIPLQYSYTAPTASNGANLANGVGGFFPAASASVPQYWFDMSTGLMKVCVTSGGSFVATGYSSANPPAILIGVAYYDGTSIQAVAPMPYGATPLKIVQNFGDGSSGAMQITSAGTTTKDGLFNFTGLSAITGTLTSTSNFAAFGLVAYAQNPVIVWNGTIASGTTRTQTGPGTGVGAAGLTGGLGGNGGGGGGSSTNAGGLGGGRVIPQVVGANTGQGGTAGTTGPGAGGIGGAAGALAATMYFANPMFDMGGALGGNGGGDGVNNGGQGGASGGYLLLRAPSVSVTGTGLIKADGGVGGNAAGGNSAAGGGGGGGCCFVAAFASYGITAGTNVTAKGGLTGTPAGTGANGGTGGVGYAFNIRLQ